MFALLRTMRGQGNSARLLSAGVDWPERAHTSAQPPALGDLTWGEKCASLMSASTSAHHLSLRREAKCLRANGGIFHFYGPEF